MILFTDLDGTLLTDSKELTKENQDAIREAIEAGHKVVISTGRPLAGATAQARALHLDGEGCYIICFNGGEIYDCAARKSLYRKCVPFDEVRYVFDLAHKRGLHIQTYDRNHVIGEENRKEIFDYSSVYGLPAKVVPDVISCLPEEPCKMLAIDEENHENLVRFQKELLPWAEGKLDLFFSHPMLLELVPTGVSKGAAIGILCDRLGIPISEAVAVGDAENDIPMIRAAGIGAVMCNGEAHTLSFADYVTTNDNNHSGVAEVIRRFLLRK